MKMKPMKLMALTAVTVLALPLFSVAVDAKEFNKGGTFTNNKGNTTNWQKKKTVNKGESNKTLTWQNKNGEGKSETKKLWNKETGTASGERLTTNAKGQTATTTWSGQKTDSGYSGSGERTGFNGKTVTGATTVTNNEDGSKTINRVLTNEEGDVRETEKTIYRYND